MILQRTLREQHLLGRSLPEQVVIVKEKPDICGHTRRKSSLRGFGPDGDERGRRQQVLTVEDFIELSWRGVSHKVCCNPDLRRSGNIGHKNKTTESAIIISSTFWPFKGVLH